VALAVLDHDNGVVHHQADRKHNGQECEQVHCEPEYLHQEYRADERHRDGDHGDEDCAQRAQEEEDDHHDNQHRLGQGGDHLFDGAL